MPILLRWLLRLGPLNPIAVRLVQNGSRRSKHFYVRTVYLAVLIIVLLWSLLLNAAGGQPSYRELAEAGASSFTVIAYIQITLICILSPVFMAGAIAQESDPKTWDILLTTPLGPGQIVLGSLLGRLFFVLALLFSSLPLFALTQYFGGVPGRSIFASYLVAAGAAVVVGATAISLSVSRLVGRRAVFTFYVSVVSYLAVTAATDALIRGGGGGAGPAGDGVTWMTGLNPFLALHALLNSETYPRATPGTFSGLTALFLERPVTAWCAASGAVSVVLVAASTVTVRLGGLQALARPSTRRAPWYRRVLGLGGKGAEYRPPRAVWPNPIAWREAASRNSTLWRILARWLFVLAGAAAGVVFIILFHVGTLGVSQFRLILLAATWTEAAVICLVAINMAATAVSREREDGTLDLLLTTPITPGAYLFGKLRGLVTYLLPLLAVPIGTLALAGLYVLVGGLGRVGGVGTPVNIVGSGITNLSAALGAPTAAPVSAQVPVVLPEAGLLAVLVLLPFAAFCVMIGLQWSLKSKGTIASVIGTVAVVGIVAGVVGVCGWQAGSDVQFLGPALAGLSPATVLYAAINPESALAATLLSAPEGGGQARIGLLMGAAIAAALYAGVVLAVHSSMVRGFDFTVRRLAGSR